ncbi:MAG TPA: hypothetical protein VFZ84_03920 [Burkholderiales bacterium]
MHMQWLGGVFAIAAVLGAQGALAQPMNGCPEGHAIQASDASGKNVTCVAIPTPVDVSGLQAQIDVEAAARAAGDGALLNAIADERSARIAADDGLRESAGTEGGIAGTYAVSGTQVCTSASRGFNSNLQPFIPSPPPPPDPNDPNPPPPPLITTVSVSSSNVSGIQTFHENGTGTLEITFHVVSHPGALFGALGTAGAGGASISTSSGTFTWSVMSDGKLVVAPDEPQGGLVVKGGAPGTTLSSTGSPRLAGVLGKDRRLITLMNDDVAPESVTFTNPSGSVFTQSRICIRERTLRRM